jgi:hypothetical protein
MRIWAGLRALEAPELQSQEPVQPGRHGGQQDVEADGERHGRAQGVQVEAVDRMRQA